MKKLYLGLFLICTNFSYSMKITAIEEFLYEEYGTFGDLSKSEFENLLEGAKANCSLSLESLLELGKLCKNHNHKIKSPVIQKKLICSNLITDEDQPVEVVRNHFAGKSQ